MNVEPPETFVIIESIVYKSNGFAIVDFVVEFGEIIGDRPLKHIKSFENIC